MEKIEFKNSLASDLIINLKAARFIALLDFWLAIANIVLCSAFSIYAIIDKSYFVLYFFAFFICFSIIPLVYGGSYLNAYNKLRKHKILYQDSGIVEKRILFPFYLKVSGVRYKGIHQLLNYAKQMGKKTTFYQYKYYANVGDKVEILHMNGYILKINKI